MRWSLRIRLSAMFFLQFATWGAWLPVLSDYLKNDLGFTGAQVAWVQSAMWLANIVAPFLAGQIVDRWLPTQWFLAGANLAGGAALLLAARQQTFPPLLAWMMVYCFFFAPTGALTAALCFRHLTDVNRQYGSVRVFGTVGWVAVGWGLSFWRWGAAAPVPGDMLRLAGWCGLASGVFCFFLPHTPPKREGTSPWAFLEALRLLGRPRFRLFLVLAFVGSLAARFYYVASAAFLRDIGVAPANMPALRTISQMAEIVGVSCLPILLRRLGIRRCLILGLGVWLVRDLTFALGPPREVAVAALALHGVAFPCFFLVSQIYVNREAPGDIRASAQALLTLITLGFGNFLGVQLSGVVMDHFTAGRVTDWSSFFAVPCVLMGVCVVAFGVFFREPVEKGA